MPESGFERSDPGDTWCSSFTYIVEVVVFFVVGVTRLWLGCVVVRL